MWRRKQASYQRPPEAMATRSVALLQLASRADAGARDGSCAPRRTLTPSFFVRAPKHLRARVTAAPAGASPARVERAQLARLQCYARHAARHASHGCC